MKVLDFENIYFKYLGLVFKRYVTDEVGFKNQLSKDFPCSDWIILKNKRKVGKVGNLPVKPVN